MTVDYYYSDDCGIDALMKRVRDPEKGVLTGFIWDKSDKTWVENWEITCGYFLGFEPARHISADEAAAFMARYGASADEC